MAAAIWKFPLPVRTGACLLSLPRRATPLSVGFQHDVSLCLWCLVDPAAVLEAREVYVAMTGTTLPDDIAQFECLGRATAGEGAYEVHVFMRRAFGGGLG